MRAPIGRCLIQVILEGFSQWIAAIKAIGNRGLPLKLGALALNQRVPDAHFAGQCCGRWQRIRRPFQPGRRQFDLNGLWNRGGSCVKFLFHGDLRFMHQFTRLRIGAGRAEHAAVGVIHVAFFEWFEAIRTELPDMYWIQFQRWRLWHIHILLNVRVHSIESAHGWR